jgi:PKD repeat protein/FtsP/CotA-like multicopper oxidase with cupredoxin domain
MTDHHDSERKRTKQRSKNFSRLLLTIGILLLLNISFASAVDGTDVASPLQTLNITTILPTQAQDVVAALTTRPTIVPPVQVASEPLAAPGLTETPDVNAGSLVRTGVAGIDQYTIRTSKNLPTQEEKEAAAANYQKVREAYLLTGTPSLPGSGGVQISVATFNNSTPKMDPGGIPHYFGPYPNWANSPMPMGSISNITIDNGGRFYTGNATVTITDAYFTGSGATAVATISGDTIFNITVTNGGTNYTAPVVIINGTGTGAAATAHLGGPFQSGMRKFVDTLPGLNPAGANNLGQYIPIAQADLTTYPGSDYYEIAVVQYSEKMHSDLPPTTLRGYVQLETPTILGDHYPLNYPNGTNITNASGGPVFAVHKPHYLGPIVVANNGTPVRVKFNNYLPIGAGGNLIIPVDTTVMGAGMGPQEMNASPINYTQNRATLHLHGGATPWISDGTPYQWITPANEYTSYPEGVSVYNVPGMPDAGPRDGSMTFYYTNQQSARLMFYHDHSHGITRLNVYAGEAAGYLVTDPVEQSMMNGIVSAVNPGGQVVIPGGVGIPLVIQDRTWVDANTIAAQDPTWYWGTDPGAPRTGDLWYPHVYMTAQNPFDRTGVNAYGRWHYGPWFFPPTNVPHMPVANPYFGDINFTGEPPQIPGVPHPSTPGEGFMDTPIVNGVAYPNMTVEPQAYRFRVLNACNDRALNLQLYVADANVTTADGRNNTEVLLVPRVPTPGFPPNWPVDNRPGGSPHPSTIGPSFIQIGTEGGFLPAPVVVENQPITYIDDPTLFNVGNVDKHALLLMSAERADVIIDFSAYAGKTLILYNDAPAAFPARVPQYDYYTGNPDLTSTGGVPTIQPGYGPNTRTVMQIKVNNTPPAAPYNLAALNAVFAKTATKSGVFESTQPPIIVSDAAYESAYNAVFPQDNLVRIGDTYKNFTTINGTWLNLTLQPKAIHDEMGGVYDTYGRMSGMLGLEVLNPGAVQQQFMPYGYSSPPTDVLMSSVGEYAGPQLGDGTQIWKITHNGVDSHPIHWHMYNVQVINRVPWDGLNIAPPDPAELGWKETVRVSPLEDTIVALRPVAVTVPFPVPDKVRAIEPNMPLGALVDEPPGGFSDPQANPVVVINHMVNYGWEYVWHCHILAHEEMDMMHAQAVNVAPPGAAPSALVSGQVHNNATNTTAVFLAWTDNSNYESDWIVQRANITGVQNWTYLMSVPSYTTPQTGGSVMAIDNSFPAGTVPNSSYRVLASNIVGDDYVYEGSAGFPVLMRNSTPSGVNSSVTVAAPTTATFTLSPTSGSVPLNVTFTDTSPGTKRGWDWDFGDGNFASDNGKQNPRHVYEIPGTYTVTLTVMNTAGNATSTQVSTVTVNAVPPPPAPTASFTGTPLNGTAPLTVSFNADASTSDPAIWATWRWSFGDGTFSSVKNANHTYTTGGIFTVSLTASNLGGTNAMTRVGYINVTAAPVPAAADKVGVTNGQQWYLDWNGNGTFDAVTDKAYNFGAPGWMPVTGDWNATGFSHIGVTNGHQWYLDSNGNGTFDAGTDYAYVFGAPGWTNVTGDWNGDGRTKIGVFNNGVWYLDWNGNGVWDAGIDRVYSFGSAGWKPVTGSWNTTGSSYIGVTNGQQWYLDWNGNGAWDAATDRSYIFGAPGWTPVVGKWSVAGISYIGVTNGQQWYLDWNGNGIFDAGDRAYVFGAAGWMPVTGDWMTTGFSHIGVTNGQQWYLDSNGNGVFDVGDKAYVFGSPGWMPVVGKWS